MNDTFPTRSLSRQESRVVLGLTEQGRREVSRREIAELLAVSPEAADHVIRSLRHKGWLERASWGRYLLIPPDQGADALGDSNLLALAGLIVEPYYFGYGTAAAHYGFTTQIRSVIWLVTPVHRRDRRLLDAEIRIVNQSTIRFFGFKQVDVLGYSVNMSDYEKTVIDCIDRPELAGGIGEAALILGAASNRLDWHRLADYLDRIKSRALTRRVGWYADHVQAEMPSEIRDHLRRDIDAGRPTFIGPKSPKRGALGFDPTWHVTVTAAPDELRSSAGMGRRRQLTPKGAPC
ncbi:MAG: hypothetical protein WAN59_15535 [Candidatus Baltobacteraceae bacterium]|jgi:predicted transcriptional regulator of viral defense system